MYFPGCDNVVVFDTLITKRNFEFDVFRCHENVVIVFVTINRKYLHTIHFFCKQIHMMVNYLYSLMFT